MEEIKTHKIFLDSSVFIKENFFAGWKLNAFLKHSATSDIELVITNITIRECLANIEEFATKAFTGLKKSLLEIDSKSKILKNVPALEDLFKLTNTFDFEKEVESLKNRFL